MDMPSSSPAEHACKINMLWNWYTIDACFVSKQWHVHSEVAFAFTAICVFLIAALVEGTRRLGREYDRRISASSATGLSSRLDSTENLKGNEARTRGLGSMFRPTWPQQVLRGLLFGVQFGAAYILMLLAMYYNGYIILGIIFGGTTGHIIFGRDTVVVQGRAEAGDNGGTCC